MFFLYVVTVDKCHKVKRASPEIEVQLKRAKTCFTFVQSEIAQSKPLGRCVKDIIEILVLSIQ